jgi:hypothetical protein
MWNQQIIIYTDKFDSLQQATTTLESRGTKKP